MAMTTDKKLLVALGVLLLLGGGLVLQRRAAEREERAYSYQAQSAGFPQIALVEEQTKTVDKITIQKPATGDGGAPETFVFEKRGEDWALSAPMAAKANRTNVESLLKNVGELKITESLSNSKDSYAEYDLTDDKALHVVMHQGDKVALDLYFGEGGSRGQMLRVGDKTGVYAVKGYSSYLYSRDIKGWRDLSVVKFDDTQVEKVSIQNEKGVFEFERVEKPGGTVAMPAADAGTEPKVEKIWTGRFGKTAAALAAIPEFEPARVDDLLRAYKSLNALDFARTEQPADVGLTSPLATVTFTLADGAKKVVHFGKTNATNNRWVSPEGSSELFTITQYASDWVMAEPSKYAKKKDDKKPADSPQGDE